MKIKYVLFGLLGLVVVGLVLLLTLGEQWAEKKIRKEVASITRLSYDTLDVAIADNKIIFKGLVFKDKGLELKVKQVNIDGIKVYTLLFTGKVELGQIAIDSASLIYRPNQQNEKQNTDNKSLQEFLLENIEITNSQAQIFRVDGKEPFLEVEFALELNEVDQNHLLTPKHIIDQIIKFKVNSVLYKTKDGLYNAGASNITFENSRLNTDSIFLITNHEKYELGQKVGHEKDWIKLSIDSAYVMINSLSSLLLDKHINYISLYRPNLNVFLDKRLPFPADNRPKLLKEMLATTTSSFSVDSIFITDADIVYEEFVKKADGPGKVSFNNLSGHVSNLYSYDKKHQIPPRLVAKCDLLNTTKLYADVSFPLKENDVTIVKGKLEPMDLTAFNTVMKYVAFTEIEQGKLNSLDFEFTYDQKTSKGKMNFAYENLKINFLNKEDAKSGGFVNEVKGFIANTFVVNSYNGYDSGKFRVGKIAYDRNMKKSMFNFWWKSILTGFQSSTGVKSSEEKVDTN